MDSVGRENLLINGTRCTVGKAKVYRRLPACQDAEGRA